MFSGTSHTFHREILGMDVAAWIAAGRDPDDALVLSTYSCEVEDTPVVGATVHNNADSQVYHVENEDFKDPGLGKIQGCHKIDTPFKKQSSAKRRLQFETPESESSVKKQRRTILANRAKRLRYKQNKKAKWSKKMAQLWKDRANRYESVKDEDGEESLTPFNEEKMNEKSEYIDTAAINESYESIQKDCELEGVHLLPQIVSPEHSKADNIAAEERLLECERERDKALKDAFHYRTLVEKLETDIREVTSTMHHRVAAVRDFWRNSVLEGRSRSGAILKKALTKRN